MRRCGSLFLASPLRRQRIKLDFYECGEKRATHKILFGRALLLLRGVTAITFIDCDYSTSIRGDMTASALS
jgi:hypothetical protein